MSRLSSYSCISHDRIRQPAAPTLHALRSCCDIEHDTHPPGVTKHTPRLHEQPQSDMPPKGVTFNDLMETFTAYYASLPDPPPDPTQKAVESLLRSAFPHMPAQELERIPTGRVQRQYKTKTPDEEAGILINITPSDGAIVFRGESEAVRSEAALLTWLTKPRIESAHTDLVRPSASASSSEPWFRPTTIEEIAGRPDMSRWLWYLHAPHPTPGTEEWNRKGVAHHFEGANPLKEYLPTMIEHGNLAQLESFDIEYNILRSVLGTPIASLTEPLTEVERKVVDAQLGRMLRRMSLLASPSGNFGRPDEVLSFPCSKEVVLRNPYLRARRNVGYSCWSDAFRALLDDILYETDKKGLIVSGETIKVTVDRFKPLLDTVQRPRLVAIDADEEACLMVHRQTPSESATDGAANSVDAVKQASDTIRVTGRLDWSDCVFGDPLLARPFSHNPSEEFRQAFDSTPPFQSKSGSAYDDEQAIEDPESVPVRLLLYQCYHAVVVIATDYIRERSEGFKHEMEGRRRLNEALSALGDLDDAGKPCRRRSSDEGPRPKRTKTS